MRGRAGPRRPGARPAGPTPGFRAPLRRRSTPAQSASAPRSVARSGGRTPRPAGFPVGQRGPPSPDAASSWRHPRPYPCPRPCPYPLLGSWRPAPSSGRPEPPAPTSLAAWTSLSAPLLVPMPARYERGSPRASGRARDSSGDHSGLATVPSGVPWRHPPLETSAAGGRLRAGTGADTVLAPMLGPSWPGQPEARSFRGDSARVGTLRRGGVSARVTRTPSGEGAYRTEPRGEHGPFLDHLGRDRGPADPRR